MIKVLQNLGKLSPHLPLSCLAIGAMLTFSGCNKDELNGLIDKMKMTKSQDADTKFCQAGVSPFAYTLCKVSQDSLSDPKSALSLHLFWKSGQWLNTEGSLDQDASRLPLYKFDALIDDLPPSSTLKFAANAGMYNSEFAPIGYTVIQGKQILSLNLNEGAGNFHLMPNGVLWWDKNNHINITESHKLAELLKSGDAKPWYASQSGPMLVIDGNIHPKFNSESTSVKIRNGVGVCDDGNIKFVTSHTPVNFYQFASFFQKDLQCPNALFLDGGIASALYSSDTEHKDEKNMGVMVGLIKDNHSKNITPTEVDTNNTTDAAGVN